MLIIWHSIVLSTLDAILIDIAYTHPSLFFSLETRLCAGGLPEFLLVLLLSSEFTTIPSHTTIRAALSRIGECGWACYSYAFDLINMSLSWIK